MYKYVMPELSSMAHSNKNINIQYLGQIYLEKAKHFTHRIASNLLSLNWTKNVNTYKKFYNNNSQKIIAALRR